MFAVLMWSSIRVVAFGGGGGDVWDRRGGGLMV